MKITSKELALIQQEFFRQQRRGKKYRISGTSYGKCAKSVAVIKDLLFFLPKGAERPDYFTWESDDYKPFTLGASWNEKFMSQGKPKGSYRFCIHAKNGKVYVEGNWNLFGERQSMAKTSRTILKRISKKKLVDL